MNDRHLVPVKPGLFNDFLCPACGAERPAACGTVWPGIHILGSYRCHTCKLEFIRDLPVGFAVDHPMAIAQDTGQLYNPTKGDAWIHEPLLKAFHDPYEGEVRIERVVNRKCGQVIILNTLDFLYGHVLLKLFNAVDYMRSYPDKGLVVIVPRMYAWLIPDDVAEAWIVDLKLGEMGAWRTAFDRFVQERMTEYREVELAKGYAHPSLIGIDIEQFTGVKPFALEDFTTAAAHITFVVRQDRLWYRNGLAKFIHRVVRRIGFFPGLPAWMQDRLVSSTIRRIRRRLPATAFTVVGLGRRRGLPEGVEDLRALRMDLDTELAWCRAYAKSQVVIGVHGSNMILPTAHAAGCVEILPYDRYGNIVQDISVRYEDRMQLFMYRFVDEFASPGYVTHHVCSMFKDFDVYRLDNRVNIF